GDRLTKRTVRLASRRRPVEAVFFARRTHDLLRVYRLAILILECIRILVLRVPVSEHSLHRSELVTTDAPRENFLPSGRRVETPLAVALHDRNRERPIVLPYYEDCGLAALRHDSMLGVVGGEGFLPHSGILYRIAGADDLLPANTPHRDYAPDDAP